MQVLHQAYNRLMEPIMTAVRRELGAIIDKLHRVDLARIVDSAPGMGGPSFYLKDLVEKLSFIKTEVLSKYNLGDAGRSWLVLFCCFCSSSFDRFSKGCIHRQVCDQNFRITRVYSKTPRGGGKTSTHERHDRTRVCLERFHGGELTE